MGNRQRCLLSAQEATRCSNVPSLHHLQLQRKKPSINSEATDLIVGPSNINTCAAKSKYGTTTEFTHLERCDWFSESHHGSGARSVLLGQLHLSSHARLVVRRTRLDSLLRLERLS